MVEKKAAPRIPKTHPDRPKVNASAEVRAFGIAVPNLPQSEIPVTTPDLKRFPNQLTYPWISVREGLQQQATLTGQKAGNVELTVAEPPGNVQFDFAVACHRLAKPLGKAPGVIAAELAANINSQPLMPFIRTAEATPSGYLNFELDTKLFGNAVLQEVEQTGADYGHENIGNGKTVVIDCSSPNVAKYMSVGHLRSTVIGESLARIYQAGGYKAIRDNHLGDWGTQFGMLGRAKELWGNEIDTEMPDADPVQKLYRLYVKIHDEVAIEKAASADGESVLEKEGRAWFKRLELGDPTAHALLTEATTQSLQEFRKVYGMLGSQFEYALGESFYVSMLPNLLDVFQQRGIAHPDDRGALTVNFPEESKLRNLVIQKSDGSSLYSTRDLAGLVARTGWFNPDKILYVVGGDQREYFRQVFAAFGMLAGDQSPQLEHVTFGMITLPEGKMSTRRGNVVFLEEVLIKAVERAKMKILEANRDLSPTEIEQISKQVGVGAVIYMDLGQSRDRNIQFDLDQALSLEGNSAPYIQYAYTRGKSILRKATEEQIQIDTTKEAAFDLSIEAELVKHLAKFPAAIAKAIETNEPTLIAAYTYRTAELFSRFYHDADILKEKDLNKRNDRLRLTAATAQVIKNGLYLLGIEAPEKM